MKHGPVVLVVLLLSTMLFAQELQSGIAARNIRVTVSYAKELGPSGEEIVVTGRASDLSGLPVPNAAVSIQVTNPQGSSVHVVLTYTVADGAFEDRFTMGADAPTGNYTIFVTVSKTGYNDASVQLVFAFVSPDFTIVVSPADISLRQGETGEIMVTVSSNTNASTVNLRVFGVPSGVNATFSKALVKPTDSVALKIVTQKSSPVGSFNLTIVGESGGKIRSTYVELIIEQSLTSLFASWAIVIILTAAIAVGTLYFVRKRRPRQQREKKPIIETVDKEYVAAARALAKLEEMRALGKIDQEAYEKLKTEYEEKLKRD